MNRLLHLIKKHGIKSVFNHWFFYRFLFKKDTKKQVKFIVFGQGRTGSTLLTKLINQHPDVFCDQEIFGNKNSPIFLFPEKFMESQSRKPETRDVKVYGFKVKIYQLFTDQKIKNVKALINRLHQRGWKFIFLYREDEMAHNTSSFKAFSLGKWFVDKDDKHGVKSEDKLYVDPIQFRKSVLWRREFSNMERECLEGIPHINVCYETDLLISENHQEVCDRIFNFLGVPAFPVKENVKKMNSENLEHTIENYNEIQEIFKRL